MKPPRKNRQPARKSIPSAAGSSRSGPKNSSRGQKRKARNTTPGAMENVSIHRSPINLMQPQLAEVGPPHHNTVRQPSVDLSNRVEDRNRSAQLTEGSNSDTRPVNSDGPAGSTNDTQKVGIGVGAPGPSFGLNASLQQGRFNQSGDINLDNSLSISTGGYSLPMGFQTSDTPDSAVGMHDPVSAHIPVKVKENIWRGQYIHFRVLLKSAK
jgi:hypothetical protein